MSEQVTQSVGERVLTLTLNRPEKKNALSDAMYGDLADGIERLCSDDALAAAVIMGAGDDFCAGNDIADFIAFSASGRAIADTNVSRFLDALVAADKPVVAAVRGRAIGIGLTMLLHCDLVYAGESTQFSAPFVSLGVVPEAASSWLLPQRLGHVQAFELFALGKTLGAAEAVRVGIANAVVPDADVQARALGAARALAGQPGGSLRASKRLMRDRDRLQALMQAEMQAFAAQMASPEAQKMFAAFTRRSRPAG